MSTPVFSSPAVFTSTELRAKPALIDDIIDLVNDGFARSQIPEPEKWGRNLKRFPTIESYLDMIGNEGLVAVIFDDGLKTDESEQSLSPGITESITRGKRSSKILVAVAAAVPWHGGFLEGPKAEEGWEIKAVAVHSDTRYLHRGLATQLYDSLTQRLIKQEMTRLVTMTEQEIPSSGCVTLWIQAAESINGDYWRKRGYQEVQKKTYGVGVWDCLSSFEMVILRKDVPFKADRSDESI